jgi:hypothetical protein
VLASVLSLAIGLLPLAAPEHVHEREDHGHAQVVVHRHVPPHRFVDHHRGHQASLDDDDAPVRTLTTVFTVPGSVDLAAPERSASALIKPPEPESVERTLTKFDIPIHGPPRAPTGPRAPPFSPAS